MTQRPESGPMIEKEMEMRGWFCLFALSLFCAGPVTAQFSDLLSGLMPTVDVTLHHPPSLGLDVKRVACAAPTGECCEEVLAEL